MNRSTTASLVTAAVIGITGGAIAATVRDPGSAAAGSAYSPSVSPTTSASTSPSASASASGSPAPGTETAPPNEPLLYFSPDRIHDGDRVVRFPEATSVSALTRIRGGYLLAEPTSSQAAEFDLWTVTRKGVANRIASVTGRWDINATGTRLVGDDLQAGQVGVWDLATGESLGHWDHSSDATGNAGFAGADVMVSQLGDANSYTLFRWNLTTGKTTKAGQGYEEMGLSPGGSYLTGAVDAEGNNADTNPCLKLVSTFLKKNAVEWQTCDWRQYGGPAEFSPDGTRLLAVPRNTDGFGPGQFAVIDASDGPGKLVAKFLTPDWTIGAQWADNNHVYLYGALDGNNSPDSGTFIKRCDFTGKCTDLVRSKRQLTVGGVY